MVPCTSGGTTAIAEHSRTSGSDWAGLLKNGMKTMIKVVQAYDRAPFAEVQSDDADALEIKLEAACRAFLDRDGWFGAARTHRSAPSPREPAGRKGQPSAGTKAKRVGTARRLPRARSRGSWARHIVPDVSYGPAGSRSAGRDWPSKALESHCRALSGKTRASRSRSLATRPTLATATQYFEPEVDQATIDLEIDFVEMP